jgi:hypothetical protein
MAKKKPNETVSLPREKNPTAESEAVILKPTSLLREPVRIKMIAPEQNVAQAEMQEFFHMMETVLGIRGNQLQKQLQKATNSSYFAFDIETSDGWVFPAPEDEQMHTQVRQNLAQANFRA